MSRNFPSALAAMAHRAEGQCLFAGHTLNAEKSLTRREVTRSRKVTRLMTVDFDLEKPCWFGCSLVYCETWSRIMLSNIFEKLFIMKMGR
jgi:hypothetical protein